MLPCFIIHNTLSSERSDLVKKLQEQTGGIIFDALMLPNGKEGCRKSHISVARLAKLNYPDSKYIVFEDDCVLRDGWEMCIKKDADIVYIGINGLCEHTIFGTHALVISPNVRDAIIEHAEECVSEVIDEGAFDHILSLLCRKYKLTIWLMDYAEQKEGIKSFITGLTRKKY